MSRLNLKYIKEEIESKIHDDSLTDAQMERWVDISQDRILRSMDCDFLLDTKPITCVADQRVYYLECGFNRILNILNESTNDILAELPERTILSSDPDLSDTGTPDGYSVLGYAEVQSQFDGASKITVVSSSASDTTQTVRIRGLVSGIETTEAISLNGTTAVDSSSTYDADQDMLIRVSVPCAGNITVIDKEDSGVLSVIPIGWLRRPMMKVALYPIPSSTDTLKALVYRDPYYLTDDEDIPDLPKGWENLVLQGALIEAHRYAYEFEVADKLEKYFQNDIMGLLKQQGNSRNSNRRIRIRSKLGSFRTYGKFPETIDE